MSYVIKGVDAALGVGTAGRGDEFGIAQQLRLVLANLFASGVALIGFQDIVGFGTELFEGVGHGGTPVAAIALHPNYRAFSDNVESNEGPDTMFALAG